MTPGTGWIVEEDSDFGSGECGDRLPDSRSVCLKAYRLERLSALVRPLQGLSVLRFLLMSIVIVGILPAVGAGHVSHGIDLRAVAAADTVTSPANRPQSGILVAYGQRGSGSIDTGSLAVFNQALALIKKYYGKKVFGIHEYRRALDRLGMVVLPHCMDEVPRVEDEDDVDPEEWFLESLRRISARCGIDAGRALLTSLNLLLNDLDPRSGLLGPNMLRELRITTSGTFGGVGVVVSPKDGRYVVISAFEGSPARKAGIQSGDTVLEIDGEPIGGLPVPEVLVKVRGRPGSTITLTVKSRRTGAISQFRMRRRTIHVPPVQYEELGSGIGYMRIVNFQQKTSSEARRALRRLYGRSQHKLNGLILDLRNNPGGLFDQAIDVANLFLSDQVITRLRGTDGATNQEFRASLAGTFPEVPMVVLVNRGSASASEILAAALKQRSDVYVMGENTFGKASVQGIFLLGRGMALRLTTAHYYTPEGRDIERIGIKPDIRIESDPETEDAVKVAPAGINRLQAEEGIRAAVEFLRGPKSPFSTPY